MTLKIALYLQTCKYRPVKALQHWLLVSNQTGPVFQHVNAIKKVILLNADVLSPKVSKKDRNSNPLIGDGASITIIEKSERESSIYCSVKMTDSSLNESFSVVSLVDGLIISAITKKPLLAINNVWQAMDEIDEWDYEEFILDFDPDDED